MSAETVQEIIVKAVTDKEYRELLFSDPEKALENFELTDEEATALKEMEREKFDVVASKLEERISKAGFGLGGMRLKNNEIKLELRRLGIDPVDK